MSERESNVEVYRALLALRLEVDRSIANDMESKVDAAFNSYDAELYTLRAQRDAMREALEAIESCDVGDNYVAKQLQAEARAGLHPDPCTCGDTGRCETCTQRAVDAAEHMRDVRDDR